MYQEIATRKTLKRNLKGAQKKNLRKAPKRKKTTLIVNKKKYLRKRVLKKKRSRLQATKKGLITKKVFISLILG